MNSKKQCGVVIFPLDEEPLLHVRSLFWLQVYPVPSVKPGRAAGSPHWKSGLEQAQSTLARLAQWFGQLVRSENPATGPLAAPPRTGLARCLWFSLEDAAPKGTAFTDFRSGPQVCGVRRLNTVSNF